MRGDDLHRSLHGEVRVHRVPHEPRPRDLLVPSNPFERPVHVRGETDRDAHHGPAGRGVLCRDSFCLWGLPFSGHRVSPCGAIEHKSQVGSRIGIGWGESHGASTRRVRAHRRSRPRHAWRPGASAPRRCAPGAPPLHAARLSDASSSARVKKNKDAWPDLHYHTVTGALVLSPSPAPRIAPSQ